MACMPGGCEELLDLSDQGCTHVQKGGQGGARWSARYGTAAHGQAVGEAACQKERSGAHSGRAAGLRSREGRVRTAAQFAGQRGGEGRRAE